MFDEIPFFFFAFIHRCNMAIYCSFCYLKVNTPEPEVELTEADLPDLQETVTKLQKEYDDAVVVKHDLSNDVRSCSERLKAATDLLHR